MPRCRPSIKRFFKAEISALRNAIDRCSRETHPQYQDYGGRGIAVDPSFADPVMGFVAFLAEIGPRPDATYSLDRINNDKGYEPGNIRWADKATQLANRRRSYSPVRDLGWGLRRVTWNDRNGVRRTKTLQLIEAHGETLTIAEWAERAGLAVVTIKQRAQRGWSGERCVEPYLRNPRGTIILAQRPVQ